MLWLLLIPACLVLIFLLTLSLGVAAARADEMSARAWARRQNEGNER